MLRTDGGKPKKVFESFITKVFITFYDFILLQNYFVISYALLNTNTTLNISATFSCQHILYSYFDEDRLDI